MEKRLKEQQMLLQVLLEAEAQADQQLQNVLYESS